MGSITWLQETTNWIDRELALWNSCWLPTPPLTSLGNSAIGKTAIASWLCLECYFSSFCLTDGHFINESKEEELSQ